MSVIYWNASRGTSAIAAQDARFTPVADIAETEAGYVIELELPGLAGSDVEVNLQDGVLSVAGERKPAQLPVATVAEDADTPAETRRVHRAERSFGKFERRFRLPKDADTGAVSALASNGVLTLEIARLAEAAPRSIEVRVA